MSSSIRARVVARALLILATGGVAQAHAVPLFLGSLEAALEITTTDDALAVFGTFTSTNAGVTVNGRRTAAVAAAVANSGDIIETAVQVQGSSEGGRSTALAEAIASFELVYRPISTEEFLPVTLEVSTRELVLGKVDDSAHEYAGVSLLLALLVDGETLTDTTAAETSSSDPSFGTLSASFLSVDIELPSFIPTTLSLLAVAEGTAIVVDEPAPLALLVLIVAGIGLGFGLHTRRPRHR